MAKYFESLVRNDPLFEIPAKRYLGLVVFRLKVLLSSLASYVDVIHVSRVVDVGAIGNPNPGPLGTLIDL